MQSWQVALSIAFSPNGELLASPVKREIKIWRIKDGKLIQTLNGDKIATLSVTFSPDGQLLASGGCDKTVKIWRIKDGKLIRILRGHKYDICSVAFSPNGQLLAFGSIDGIVRIWQIKNNRLIQAIKLSSGPITYVTFSSDGKFLVNGGPLEVKVWNIQNSRIEWKRSISSIYRLILKLEEITKLHLRRKFRIYSPSMECFAFSPNKHLLAIGFDNGIIEIWRIQGK